MKRLRRLLAVSLTAIAAPFSYTPVTSAQTYVGVDLYGLGSSSVFTGPRGVSSFVSAGQVVGSFSIEPNSSIFIKALVWKEPGDPPLDFTPTNLGYFLSAVYGTNGSQQVGETGNKVVDGYGMYQHAALWNNAANTAVDLHPTNLQDFEASVAYGLSSSQQVGAARAGQTIHAIAWNGAANSAIDLHPSQLSVFQSSMAYATDGVEKVGKGYFDYTGADFAAAIVQIGVQLGAVPLLERIPGHALLWNGSPESAIDLHPPNLPGIETTIAFGVGGGQQVGRGGGTNADSPSHALLWQGSAASIVDLTPTQLGITSAIAYATDGHRQVGLGGTEAMLWHGTAQSATSLHALLPPNFTSSAAYSIDSSRNIFGLAFDGAAGEFHAVKWIPIPEPSSGLLIVAYWGLWVIYSRERRFRLI